MARRPATPLALAGHGAIVLGAPLLVALRLPAPTSHAYAATGATVATYAIFHAGLAAIMVALVRARIAAGFIGGAR